MESPSSYKVLNFFYDEENSCALTIVASETRWHVIADVHNLKNNAGAPAEDSNIWESYSHLLAKYKQSVEGEDCGSRDESIDSGVDLDSFLTKGTSNGSKLPNGVDVEAALYDWLMSPLRSEIGEMEAEEACQNRKQTLSAWYSLPTRFYSLKAHDRKLHAEEIESTPDLDDRMARLRPDLGPVPKYIRNIDVPWVCSSDLEVSGCSNSPPPYHPTIVQLLTPSLAKGKKKSLFFKSVDNANIQPTKREISLLHQLEKKGLHDKIRCPRLEGIVTQGEGDKSSIMGFLQTLIPSPTPLTEKFECCIEQAKREKWAADAQRIKETLHEHGIIWGDAKGDNFVVDSLDELWIIDFGGSYTEGWIDPDIAETKQGDNMGVDKVVNALRDPTRNIARGSGDEDEDEDESKKDANTGEKRKGPGDDDDQQQSSQCNNKRQRAARARATATIKETVADANGTTEPRYCYCGGVSSGRMIGCDGSACQMEWFHIECTNLTELPGEEEAWFCRSCESA